MDKIVNKVAQSSLEVFDLEDYYPDNHVVELDVSQWLTEGILLKEKEFRQHLKNYDFSFLQDKYVAITCKTDAILPAWTFALVTLYVSKYALKTIHGNLKAITIVWYNDILSKTDYSIYTNKPVILKGCSKKSVPNEVYSIVIQHLTKHVKSVMFGEACSAVPLYKKRE